MTLPLGSPVSSHDTFSQATSSVNLHEEFAGVGNFRVQNLNLVNSIGSLPLMTGQWVGGRSPMYISLVFDQLMHSNCHLLIEHVEYLPSTLPGGNKIMCEHSPGQLSHSFQAEHQGSGHTFKLIP